MCDICSVGRGGYEAGSHSNGLEILKKHVVISYSWGTVRAVTCLRLASILSLSLYSW